MTVNSNKKKTSSSELHTPIMACFFIILAAIVLWDTTTYSDADSYIFPRAVATIMIALSIMLIVRWLITVPQERLSFDGNNFRRASLVFVMLMTVLAMPWLGFLISGLGMFLSLIFLSMYDPWTPKKLIFYPLAGVGLVLGFYLIFKELLLVPLPTGSLLGV